MVENTRKSTFLIFSGAFLRTSDNFLLAGGKPGRNQTLVFSGDSTVLDAQENWVVTSPLGLVYDSRYLIFGGYDVKNKARINRIGLVKN